jgi:hypothetical protein
MNGVSLMQQRVDLLKELPTPPTNATDLPMKPFVISICVLSAANALLAQVENPKPPEAAAKMLDLSPFYRERFITKTKTNNTFQPIVGVQVYDGLPFRIEGRGWVYGRKEAEWVHSQAGRGGAQYPDFIGIAAGRKFDELHVLHAARWADVEGETIAQIRLNYEDGTAHDFPVGYGVHVRDEQRLQSEEKEILTDSETKVIFRGQPESSIYKSTARLFKSRFVNPHPEKVVKTIDVISARKLSAYYPVAATVANADPKRPLTSPVKLTDGSRSFSRMTTIRVMDPAGKPIAGALVDCGMNVAGTSVIASPVYTSTNGEAVIHYPGTRTTSLSVSVEKAGYTSANLFWSAKNIGTAWWQRGLEYIELMKGIIPATNSVTLMPIGAPAQNVPSP